MIPDEECAGSTGLPSDYRKSQRYEWTVERTNILLTTIKERKDTLDNEPTKNLLKSIRKAKPDHCR